MTYCLGWKYNNNLFLLADSAVTKKTSFIVSHSSFGELHQNIEGKNVEESLLKITPISNDSVLTFSGDVILAKSIIEFIKTSYEIHADMNHVLSSINASLGPFRSDKHVAIIVGNYSNEKASLFRWETSFPENVVEGEDIVWTGSLPPAFAQIGPLLIQEFMKGKMPTERMLPIIIPMMQSLGIHNNLIKFGVGGIFVGIQLNENGYQWNKDSFYIVADSDFLQIDYVKSLIRENALVIKSSVGNITRILFDYMNNQPIDKWINKWKDSVNVELKKGNSCFFCIMNRQFHNVIIIRSKNCLSETEYLKVRLLDNGNTIKLKIRPDLKEMFKTPVAYEKGNGSLPLSFRFLDYVDYYDDKD